MILATRKALDEETQWIRVEHRVRTWVYNVMHELVHAQLFNSLIYKLLLIIETLQFLWYAIHPHFSFLWTVQVVDWLREFLRYLQFDGFLTDGRSSSQDIFIVLLYLVFAIEVLMTILIVFNIRLRSKKKQTSTIMAYSIKALSGYMLLLNTAFTLPFYYIFLATFICRNDDPIHGDLECYQGVYFLHFVVALIGILILIPTTTLCAILCIDLNPWSSAPFAAPRSRLSLVKLAIKIVIPIYFIVDYKADAAKEFVIIYTIFWLLMLVLRYRQTPYYNKSVFNWILGLEMLLFWVSLVSVLHAFIDDYPIDNIGFLFLWVGAPFISFTFAVIVNKRRKIYRKLLMKNLKKDTEVEMYIINIISLIEERGIVRKRMTLEGMLKYHMKSCTNKEFGCVCHSLATEYYKEQETPDRMWYTWVKAIILEGLQKFPKSSRLHLLHAYVQREKLRNRFKALFEIMFAYNNKPTLEEEFSIHRYKNVIEEEMIESDMKIAESKGVNVNIIVEFENKFVDFQVVLSAAVDLHLDFWRELLENNPEIQKLQSLGSMITKSVEEVAKHYKALININSNQVKMLKVYGNFLKDIVNDEAEGQKILEKAEYTDRSAVVNRQFLDNERLKYGDNSNTCIITVSGDFNSMGTVTNLNNEITRILGFSKSDLIGQNISRTMPAFLSEIHDSFMQNYFESSDAKVIAIERVVFPVSKSGYIVPCTLMAKVLPNLDDGLKLVGFLKEIDKDNLTKDQEGEAEEEEVHYIMYDGNTGIIHGITNSCRKEFGIPASLVQGADVVTNEFTIDHIFPELAQINLDELKSAGAIVTVLNTSSLGQDYIIEKEDSEGSDYEQPEEKDKKFRKAKVKISLFQDDEYGDISLKVLKFTEIREDGEHSAPTQQQTVKDNDETKNEEQTMKVRPGEQKSIDGEGSPVDNQGGSEIDSNANNELNDEIRDLKEFKGMISEKTVPKSIKLLRNAVILIYLIILGLIALSLAFNGQLRDEFTVGTTTASDGYQRHNILAEINFKLRKLQLLATGVIQTSSTTEKNAIAAALRNEQVELIDELRDVTLQIGDDQDQLKSQDFPAIETDSILIESLIQTGVKNETRFFSDAMSQYTSHATSASNAALTSFVVNDVTDSTKASFYYVKRNGLGPLRRKSEENADMFTGFYLDRTSTYNLRFEIIMIALMALIMLSELILIPIIFSVHKTATKVLSLFGYIPLSEISALAAKCERYVQLYLENHKAQQDYAFEYGDESSDKPSKTSRLGNQTYVEVNQSPDQNNTLHAGGKDDIDLNASYLVEMSLEDSTRKISGLRVPETQMMKQVNGTGNNNNINIRLQTVENRPGLDNTSKALKDDVTSTLANRSPDPKKPGQGKEEEKKVQAQENEEDLDAANDRPQKLLNSKDNTKARVIIQFCFIGLVFIAYFAVDYIFTRTALDNIKKGFNHLQLISQRMPNVRFLNTFTLEVIAEKDYNLVYKYPGQPYIDFRIEYQSRALTNNNQLKDSARGDFPSEFDSYISIFNLYEGGDLCSTYYASNDTVKNQCLNVGGGLLTKGLTLSITRIAQLSNDLINQFNATAMDLTGQKQVINDDKFDQAEVLIDMIAPVVDASKDKFLASFKDYLDYTWTIARVRFGVFVSLALVAFVVLWIPYLKSLKDKIFRTKGMLNMIPMELITKNANLRTLFVNSGDILQAVK